MYVDMDGKGETHESAKLLTLKNVDTTIDDLIQIIKSSSKSMSVSF